MLDSLVPDSLAQLHHTEAEEEQTVVKPMRRVRPAADQPAADENWTHLEESEVDVRPNRRSRLESDS